jgi:serine/threonine-protein kinase
MVGEAYAQHLANVGRFDEAIAEQQRIVAAKIADMEETSSGADAGWGELMLGGNAQKAGRPDLGCSAFKDSETHFANAERLDRLVEFHKTFLPNLRANLAKCAQGRPLSEFLPLR